MEIKGALPYSLPVLGAIISILLPPPLAFLPHIILGAVFIAMRYDGRVPLAFGGAVFALAGAALFFDETIANGVSIQGYWLAASGVIVLLASILPMPEQRK